MSTMQHSALLSSSHQRLQYKCWGYLRMWFKLKGGRKIFHNFMCQNTLLKSFYLHSSVFNCFGWKSQRFAWGSFMLQMGFSSPLEESLHLVKLGQKFQFAHVQERYLELTALFVNNSFSYGLYSLNRTTPKNFSFQELQITVAQRNWVHRYCWYWTNI